MPRNFSYLPASPSVAFDATTHDVVLPTGAPGFAKLHWMNWVVTIDRSIVTARIMNLQLRDKDGSVLLEIPDFVAPSPQTNSIWPVFFKPELSSQFSPFILTPGGSFRLYDTRGISVATDSAVMTSALVEF